MQSRRLIDRFHFPPDRVFTIGTGLAPEFFRERTPEVRARCRDAMSRVLGGSPAITPTPVDRVDIGGWMSDQRPIVLAQGSGQELDLTAPDALVLLQPTRIVARKRIWKDWELVAALLGHERFREEFARNRAMTLTLQITGPVPIEHQECLEQVVDAYGNVLDAAPTHIADRVFLALSAGWQSHPTLDEDLDIVDIYQLADLVVFPSLTEGRGLPIVEASAAGVPIICSRYDPAAVFGEVVGEHLPVEQRVDFELFPDDTAPGTVGDDLLERVTGILLDPASQAERNMRNRSAVLHRSSMAALRRTLELVLARLDPNIGGR